jgi:hypothetical protein
MNQSMALRRYNITETSSPTRNTFTIAPGSALKVLLRRNPHLTSGARGQDWNDLMNKG